MPDKRDRIIADKKRIVDLQNELRMTITAFRQIGCRYRAMAPSEMCAHPRFAIKKYPQHQPVKPRCNPETCPRN